jgi:putative copper resistance protein D
LRGLSRSAAAALLLVLASGAFNAWRGLGSSPGSWWAGLAYSPWGHLLALKLALTALVIGCGALNRLVYLPRFEREDPRLSLPWEREDRFAALYATISRIVTLEAGLMALVLACAAWLAQSAPAS